jgi:hypothetical protein
MKILAVAMLSIFLVACDGAKAQLIKKLYENRVSSANQGTVLEAGTLISWGCDEYTRLNEVADGQGGSTTEEVERSPDCGWNPPEAGTVSETRCEDPYTLVTVFNDGEYGFYEEEEEKNEECGYVAPVVEIVKETGDRFDPVLFNYEEGSYGEPTLEVTVGTVSLEDGVITIYGTGEVGEGTLLVDDEEYRYSIVEEPRCAMQDNFSDCRYYRYSGRSTGYIYYGEDDERVVEWDIAVIYSTGGWEEGATVITPESDPNMWNNAEYRVSKYNEAYEISGVHVRFVLVGVLESGFGDLGGLYEKSKLVDADVVIGLGSTCDGACGCAPANTVFYENAYTTRVIGTSVCGVYTDLHEIGHAVGLAHGPQNSANQASGYIWRDFGHGWGASFCGFYADIMSYSSTRISHHNSVRTCREVFGENRTSIGVMDLDWPSGSREYADAAYHINRVRYDVSLIYTEGVTEETRGESDAVSLDALDMDIIVDRVDRFENGPEMVEQERRSMNILTKEK